MSLRNRFDSMLRQYEVKSADIENLWTSTRTWPVLNSMFYDSVTQTYTITASDYNCRVPVYALPEPFPVGTTISVTLFIESGRYESSGTMFRLGCVNIKNSVDGVWPIDVSPTKSMNLANTVWKQTCVLSESATHLLLALPNITVTEEIRFRVMLVVGDTPADTFKPYGMAENAWLDGLKSGFPSVKMLGKAEQQTYTGKNVLDWDDFYFYSQGGVTATLDRKTKEFVLNGTVSVAHDLHLGIINPKWTVGETYTVTAIVTEGKVTVADVGGGNTYSLAVFTRDNNTFIRQSNLKSTEFPNILSFTGNAIAESGEEGLMLYLQMWAVGTVFENVRIKFQIEKGNTFTGYEPYTGGIPAPNPEYPQEVKVNNAKIVSMSRNLVNVIDRRHTTDLGVTWESKNGTIYILSGSGVDGKTEVTSGLTPYEVQTVMTPGTYTIYTGATSDVWYSPISENGAIGNRQYIFCSTITTVSIDTRFVIGDVQIYIHPNNIPKFPLSPMLLRGEYTLDTLPDFMPYHDGGEAVAPNLMRAVDGTRQSTYDAQTGEYVNWWRDKITLNGSEWWSQYTTGAWKGFITTGIFPDKPIRAAYWSNQFMPLATGQVTAEHVHLWCGFSGVDWLAVISQQDDVPFWDDTLEDKGVSNWKAFLAEHPLEVWAARSEPEITNIGPNRLTCPTGYGHIIQVDGDIPDCPIEVKYLTHGGHKA